MSGATLTGRLEGYLYLQETGLHNIQADLWTEGGTAQFAYPGGGGGGGSFEQVDPAPMLDRQTGQGTTSGWLGRTTLEQPRSELAVASLLRS